MVRMLNKTLFGDRLHRLSSSVMKDPIADAVVAGAELISTYAKDSIIEGSISGPGHVPSLPGQPPNADTHALDQSIHVVEDRANLKATVTADDEAALPMEFGTSTVAERPFMRPASVAERPAARLLILAAVNQAIANSRSS
jgi:hypothetical protein